MNSYIVFAVMLCGLILVHARPQVTVECKRREVSPGNWKFTCEDSGSGSGSGGSGSGGSTSNPDPPTLNLQHVLWIQQDGGQSQTIDVEVPNYKINELIKAGFKGAPAGNTRVNVLLKRPDVTYNAEVDRPQTISSAPSVAIQYEPVQSLLVHYPNDKPYSPLSGPILPPA